MLFNKLLAGPMTMIFNEKRMDYVFSMNRILRGIENTDAVLYASDDLEFALDSISKAVQILRKNFPDGDGLIGLRQQNRPYGSKSAFGLVGRKFVNRFPNHQMFCPDYVHYGSDTELGDFARSINRFIFCEEAILNHLDLRDETDKLARSMLKKDSITKKLRQSKGLLWGKNFERLG